MPGLKIGYDAKRAFLNRSGLGNYSRSIISLMQANYPDNSYFLYSPSSDQTLFSAPGNSLLKTPEGVLGKTFPSAWRSAGISSQLKKDGIQLYHGLSNELPSGLRQRGIRSLVTIHDLIFLHYPQFYPWFDSLVYKRKFSFAAKSADRVIAVSEATRQEILSEYAINPERVKVAYQTCNESFTRKVEEEEKAVIRARYHLPDEFILSVGTLEERKNSLSILKAVYAQSLDIPVVLIGRKTSYFSQLREFITKTGMENRVIFPEFVDSSDLPAIYQSAQIFIYPSLIEGFGIPILEALFSGTPVITSKGGCFGETGGDAAIYINPLDFEEIGDKIRSVLADQQLYNTLIMKGYSHAESFTGDKIAGRINSLYQEVLND